MRRMTSRFKQSQLLYLIQLIFCGALSLSISESVAQDSKREFVPERSPEQETPQPKKVTDLGPSGPRINSMDALRREKESKIKRQGRNVEKKLIRLIKNTPDTDRRKPQYLDRLASLYWQMAGDVQNQAYVEEERCFDRSKKSDADIGRCDQVRIGIEQKAENARAKAIEVYKYIVSGFPNFEEIDRILFALGFNYQQKEQNEDAKQIYTELIQNFNDSPLLPDALFNMADIYFGSGDIANASQLYNHVISNFPKASVYIYAIYKLGWCYYNRSDFQSALNQFIQVIEYQNKLSQRQLKKNRLSLKKEAQRDMIRVYVNIEAATASGGIKLIKTYAPKRYAELAEQLADLYSGTGQFLKSNQILRRLISDTPKSYRVVGYQRRISENVANTNRPDQAILELKRLVTLWRSVKNAEDAEPKRVKADHKGIELQLNAMARRYHNQALETKAIKDFNTALELYETYVESFPNEKSTYEMNFFYGELLYRLDNWREAATVYEKVLKLQPQGKYTKDAAHGALLAYKAMLKRELDEASINQIGKDPTKKKKKSKKRKKKGKKDKDEPKKKVTPKEIPEDYKGYLRASELYRSYVQESEYLVDIQYEEARVYYVFNHFDKAIPLFKSISERHPQHRVAVYAANLLLECYNITGDFDGIANQVNIFVPIYTPQRDKDLSERLQVLKSELDFKKCSMMETREEYVRAARCFLAYGKAFPNAKIVDKAYFNAALNYDRVKQVEKAIQARAALVNNVEDSELVPKAFFQIAKNLQSLAIYGAASNAFEQFAVNYPKREEATEALRIAAQYRLGLGELDKASTNLKNYIKRLGRKDRQKRMVAYFTQGEILKERRQWKRMINHYKSFTKRFKREDPGFIIRGYTALGNAYLNLPKKYRDTRKANAAYSAAVKVFKKVPKAQLKDLPQEVRSAAAEASFQLTQYKFAQIKKDDFTKVKRVRSPATHIKAVKNNVNKLLTKISSIKSEYEAVMSLNVESWGLAALSQIGEVYYFAFTTLEKSPPPRKFDYETKEMFKGAMVQMADPLRQKAVMAYQACLSKALKLQWFNKWTESAELRLAKIDPSAFHYSIEERSPPVHFHNPRVQRGLVTTLPDEEDME